MNDRGGGRALDLGQAIYGPVLLPAYDAMVYGVFGPYIWRCPLAVLVAHYGAHLSDPHLDVGVATGRVLDESSFPVERPDLTLMDLNPNALRVASRRLARYGPQTRRADVLGDWGLEGRAYGSIALTHVVHCLPGPMSNKGRAFEEAERHLAPGGTLFGATILGMTADHSAAGRALVRFSNRLGFMSNLDDDVGALEDELGGLFDSFQVDVVGTVALFSAKKS